MDNSLPALMNGFGSEDTSLSESEIEHDKLISKVPPKRHVRGQQMHAKQSKPRSVPQVIHSPATINPPHNLTPLELAQFTAAQVAQSTGEAVEKLAAQKLQHGGTPHEQNESHQQYVGDHVHTPLKSRSPESEQDAGPSSERRKHLQQGNAKTSTINSVGTKSTPVGPSTQVSRHTEPLEHVDRRVGSADSDGDACPIGSISPIASAESSPCYGQLANSLHSPANVNYPEGYSPAEKAAYAAEIIAGSTGVAVQKLSTSLSERSTLSSADSAL